MTENRCNEPDVLLSRAKAGHNGALGDLLMYYRSYLSLLARAQLGGRLRVRADASDIVQETFLEAKRDFDRFRGSTEPELLAWLRTMLATNLANVVRRYYGTQRRDIRLEQSMANALNQSSRCVHSEMFWGGSSPSQRACKREQAVLLAEALKRLPRHYSEVILLRNVEGHSFADVANRMNRSVDSVQKLWVRALSRLRGLMGESD